MLQILSEVPISAYQLREKLDKTKKRDKELNFRAAKTEEHLASINTPKGMDELFEKISKMDIPRIKEQHIRKMLDLMPATIKDLKLIIQGYTISLSNENMKKIVDVINEAKK